MELSEFADNINEVDREKPYDAETFRTAAINKLKYLYKIRDLMESEDYNKKRKQFEKETERLFAAIDKLTEHIGIFEEEETDRIIKDDTLTEEEKNKKCSPKSIPEFGKCTMPWKKQKNIVRLPKKSSSSEKIINLWKIRLFIT